MMSKEVAGTLWTDPKAKPFIRIDKVTKKFSDFVAVSNVSLDIYKGELFSLLGGHAASAVVSAVPRCSHRG